MQRTARTLIDAASRVSPTKRATKNRRRRLRAVPIERHHSSERENLVAGRSPEPGCLS